MRRRRALSARNRFSSSLAGAEGCSAGASGRAPVRLFASLRGTGLLCAATSHPPHTEQDSPQGLVPALWPFGQAEHLAHAIAVALDELGRQVAVRFEEPVVPDDVGPRIE